MSLRRKRSQSFLRTLNRPTELSSPPGSPTDHSKEPIPGPPFLSATNPFAGVRGALTTVARKHPYWKTVDLPLPTKDLGQLREDFYRWGYCLIEDGTSPQQTAALQERVSDQAAAERALEIAYLTEAQQHVWSLVNKGDLFVACMRTKPKPFRPGP